MCVCVCVYLIDFPADFDVCGLNSSVRDMNF